MKVNVKAVVLDSTALVVIQVAGKNILTSLHAYFNILKKLNIIFP